MSALFSVWFDGGEPKWRDRWARLAAVLERTARASCPGWEVKVVSLPMPDREAWRHRRWSDVLNTAKLRVWAAQVAGVPDGTRLLLCDADMAVAGRLDDAWDLMRTDFAVCACPGRLPLNAGAIYLRVTPRTRALMATWAMENDLMLDDPALHLRWRQVYGGMNQASLGKVMSEGRRIRQLTTLPSATWNACVPQDWADFAPGRTRLLHVKSELRGAVLLGARHGNWRKAREFWEANDVLTT